MVAEQVVTASAPTRPPETLDATEVGSKPRRWTLQLFRDGIRGEREDGGASFHVLRARLLDSIQVMDGLLIRRTLVVRKPRRTTLKLEPPAFRRLSAWVGDHTLLRLALKGRLSWTIPIGILFVLGSVPLPGDPEAGIEAVPFSPVSAALGALLILQGLASKRLPRPALFLLDALWFLGLAADTLSRVWAGQSPWTLVIVPLQLGLAVSGLRLWRRFREVSAPVVHR